jgi:predicted glycoside hydrolase/deacetylase ChbG (UPF0249 family)
VTLHDRVLIVNADDFGLTPAINRGIAAAHERGIVTSASLMVRGHAAEAAADYARGRPTFSVGLHVDLAEWSYVDGEWRADYEVVDVHDADGVAREVRDQLDRFQGMMERVPTHLDSHQHVHREQPVGSILTEVAAELDVPLRDQDSRVRYRGDFYGQSGTGEPMPQGVSVDALELIIGSLPQGWTELGCHPGEPDDELVSMYRTERAMELEVLCDPRVRQTIERHGVVLASFADLARA